MELSQNLKFLRRKEGKTQDDLALFLGISSQAVSKWERDEGFPDITLLPKIAGYFHVSIDELLGVDHTAKKKRIDEFFEEYKKLRHHVPTDPSYKLDEGIALIRKALLENPGDLFLEQLLAGDLVWKGKQTSDMIEKNKLYDKVFSLCEDILARSTDDRWRSAAKRNLLVMYGDLGMTERALNLAYQMPHPSGSCGQMLTYVLKGEKLQEQQKLNAAVYYQLFRETIVALSDSGIETENMVHEKKLALTGIEPKEYLAAIENVVSHKK